MNKKIIFPLCLIFISTLLACSDKQDTPQIDLKSEQNVMRIEDNEKLPFATSEPKVTNDKWFESNDSSKIDQISCSNKNIKEWYTFDEKLEQPKCKSLSGHKIKNYQCSVEKNVLGLNFDAIRITLKDNRVFAFHSLEQCQDAVEMWESNGI